MRDADDGFPELSPDAKQLVLQRATGERIERVERLIYEQNG